MEDTPLAIRNKTFDPNALDLAIQFFISSPPPLPSSSRGGPCAENDDIFQDGPQSKSKSSQYSVNSNSIGALINPSSSSSVVNEDEEMQEMMEYALKCAAAACSTKEEESTSWGATIVSSEKVTNNDHDTLIVHGNTKDHKPRIQIKKTVAKRKLECQRDDFGYNNLKRSRSSVSVSEEEEMEIEHTSSCCASASSPVQENGKEKVDDDNDCSTSCSSNESDDVSLQILILALARKRLHLLVGNPRTLAQYNPKDSNNIHHSRNYNLKPDIIWKNAVVRSKSKYCPLVEDMRTLAHQRASRLLENCSLTSLPHRATLNASNNLSAAAAEDEDPIVVVMCNSGGGSSKVAIRRLQPTVSIISFGRNRHVQSNTNKPQHLNVILDGTCIAPVGFQSRFRYALPLPLHFIVCRDDDSSSFASSFDVDDDHDHDDQPMRYVNVEYTSSIIPGSSPADHGGDSGVLRYRVSANNEIVAEGNDPKQCWVQALYLKGQNEAGRKCLLSFKKKCNLLPKIITSAIAHLRRCVAVLNRIAVMPECAPFIEPCYDTDYRHIIYRPLSIQCVRKKLATFEYVSVYEFAFDVRLIFLNAQVYHMVKSDEFQWATQLLTVFDHIFACWVLNTEFREYDGPWSKWWNLRMLNEDEQCRAGGFCTCCLLRECDVAKLVPSRRAKKKAGKAVVNRHQLIACRYCRDEFFPGCLMESGHTIPNDPRLLVCHRCASVSKGSIEDVYSDCLYHEFYTVSPSIANNNLYEESNQNASKSKASAHGKKQKEVGNADVTDCNECPNLKTSGLKEGSTTSSATGTTKQVSSSNYVGNFWRPVTRQGGDKMHGWFERVVITENSEQTSLKANKSKYKYLAPNGGVCATQADANKIAMVESDELALCYFGTSFKRRRFKNKVLANILKKCDGNVPLSALHEKYFLPLSDSLVIVKSVDSLSAEVAHNVAAFPFISMVADEIPPDGFFGLTNNGVRLRIEGLSGVSSLLPPEYEPVEVRHALSLSCREMLIVQSQEDKLQAGALHRIHMFLFDFASMTLDREVIQRYLLPSKSAMRDKMCSVCSVLPSPDPLAISSIHSLIPEGLMSDVIAIWEFFAKFGKFVGRSSISLADTCQALALDQSWNEVYSPSLYQLLFDEMATCVTRVLLLDFRHLGEQSENEWNEVLAALPLNVFSWPDVAIRSSIARSYLGQCSDRKVLNILRKHTPLNEFTSASPSVPNTSQQLFHPKEFLEDNPDCWSTEKKISCMVYLIDEALQTHDICLHLDKLNRETSNDAINAERRNRRIHIVEPSIQFANMENDDDSFQDCEVDSYDWEDEEGPLHIRVPVIQCSPISIEQSHLESEFKIWCQSGSVEGRDGEDVFKSSDADDTACSICGLRPASNGPFFSSPSCGTKSDLFIITPSLSNNSMAARVQCHESCARAVFSSRFLCQLQKDDIVSRALSGRISCFDHNFEDRHRSIPLGSDDEDNEYIFVGGKRNVVFRRSGIYGWGAYAGPEKLKQLLAALSNKRNKSFREDQLMMALAVRCDFHSLVGDQMDPLSKSRYNRLQFEFSKSEEQMTQLLEKERNSHGALRQQCEIWRGEMQTAIRAKVVEMRSTIYNIAQGNNNKLSRFRRVGDSRLRLRVSLSRYDGDEFILRHSMAQTLREIQAQTIAHRVLLRVDWCHRLQHSVENNTQASLPFIFHNFDNMDAIPRVSWDLGFNDEENCSPTGTNTDVGIKNISTDTKVVDNTTGTGHPFIVDHIKDGELDQASPIARFNASTNELDSIFIDIECAAKALDVQVEQAMRQRDDNHFRFMATKLKRSITTSNSQQALKKIHSAIKNSQIVRTQERIKAHKGGYCTKQLIIASALGYLGNGSLHGFRFEFAKFVINLSPNSHGNIPINANRLAIVDGLDMGPVPAVTFSSDANANTRSEHTELIPPAPKDNKSIYAMYTVNNVVLSNEDLDRHIEPMPMLSLALGNYRFEKLKAELWNICECMPRRPIYARDQFAMHVLNLDHGAWRASLLIASNPCDLLRCVLSLVRAIPGHWLAKSFRHDGEECLRDLLASYAAAASGTDSYSIAVAPIASIIYALDRAVGVNSHTFGPWQSSRCAPGVDVTAGYCSLPRHCHTPLQVAGGPPIMPRTCFNNMFCTREPHHRGTCNNRAIEVAEKKEFFPAMPE